MRAIDKQGKNYDNYFEGRLVKSLRNVKYFVDKYYFEEDFNEDEKNLEREVGNHFSLVEVLRNLDFYPEDYVPLNKYLTLMHEALGQAIYPKIYWDEPLNDFLNKKIHVAPFDDYLQKDALQLSFNFN